MKRKSSKFWKPQNYHSFFQFQNDHGHIVNIWYIYLTHNLFGNSFLGEYLFTIQFIWKNTQDFLMKILCKIFMIHRNFQPPPTTNLPSKGQIKPKADWRAVDSPKKRRNEFILFPFLLFTANKTNLFDRFMGESTACQSAFGFIWPLAILQLNFF